MGSLPVLTGTEGKKIVLVLGNQTDRSDHRAVSLEEGRAYFRQRGCLFHEISVLQMSQQEALELILEAVREFLSLRALEEEPQKPAKRHACVLF